MADYNVQLTISASDSASDILRNVAGQLDQAGDNTARVNREAQPASDSLKTMADNFNLAFNAAIVQRAIQLTTQIYSIGVEARNTANVFEALTNSAGLSEQTLALLQERTHGVVDNTTLMAGANRFMMMGLAENEDDLVNMIGLITDLSLVTGRDLNTAFQDFGMLLANQSVLRLDNFGLSSERVRARIEELQAASEDLSDEDAFNMAVFEEGAAVLERVAPAIEQNTRLVDQFGASVRNAGQNVGENLVANVDRLLGDITGLASGEGTIAQQLAREQQEIVTADEVHNAQELVAAFNSLDPTAMQELLQTQGDPAQFFRDLADYADQFTSSFGATPETFDMIQQSFDELDFTPAEEAAADFFLSMEQSSTAAIGAVGDDIDVIEQQLQTIAGQTYTVRVRVEVDDPNGIVSGGGFGGIAQTVRANGGTVPGADARTTVNGR